MLTRPITDVAVPSATSAEASGVAIAKSEPNTMNRTIPAVRIPRPVPPTDGGFATCASCPETATTRLGPDAASAVATNSFARSIERSCACRSNATVANATVPSGLV